MVYIALLFLVLSCIADREQSNLTAISHFSLLKVNVNKKWPIQAGLLVRNI